MLTLINSNMMNPPIAPVGLDYIAGAAASAKIETSVLDLCLETDPDKTLKTHLASRNPQLIGISFRNVDDSFWPSAKWFVPDLHELIKKIRKLCDCPIVIGGVGYSIFARQILDYTGADFGIRGDGEEAIVQLYQQLQESKKFSKVTGLLWKQDKQIIANPPAWPEKLSLPAYRNFIDNNTYFNKGGQCGFETKRGCDRKCIYCADPLAKGTSLRLRNPSQVADEVEFLLAKGIDVLHTCDAEFNIPRNHAASICKEFIHRGLGDKIQWYAYLAVLPFDAELASLMRRAGCVGINFTSDAASEKMLKTYRQPQTKVHLASAVKLCRDNNIKVMTDLLLGGPGETVDTLTETIEFIKQIKPDCSGASLGVRIYPGTEMQNIAINQGPLEKNPNILRKYDGPVNLFKPTFYIEHSLGPEPAALVRDLIAGDKRFFEPMPDTQSQSNGDSPATDHNYNDNTELVNAIENGARGAYWDILHKLRSL